MKLNKLICSLIIIGSASLTACMPSNVGANNNTNPATMTIESSDITNATLKTGFPVNGKEAVDYLTKGIAEAAFDLPLGPFRFITSFAIDGIIAAIFGEQKDQTQEMLKDMDKKLDQINNKLETSIGISEITLSTLSQFYANNMMNNWSDGLSEIDKLANKIGAKYSGLVTQRAFGNVKSGQLKDLYDYAKEFANNGQNRDTLLALDAVVDYRIVKNSYATTSADLFNTFIFDYKAGNGNGEILTKLKNGKQNYLSALMNMGTHQDFMTKINSFNGQVLLYQTKLFSAYQKLYDIQLAQLAYRYASGANIQLDNLDLHDVKATGLKGFKQAVVVLDRTYNSLFTQLTAGVKANFSPVNDRDLYNFINIVFNSDRSLLDKNSFVLNNEEAVTPGSCIINSFAFNEVNKSSGNTTGVATLGAKCMVKYNAQTHEATYINTSIDIPYVMSGGIIKRYAVAGIYFDLQSQQLKTAVQTGNSATDLNLDDVNKLCNTTNDIGKDWNVNKIAGNRWGKAARYYQGFEINTSANIYVYPVKYIPAENEIAGLPATSWTASKGGYSASITGKLHLVGEVKSPELNTRNTSYLAVNNGKAFCINILAYHYNENYSVKTEFGIHSIVKNSARIDSKNLMFDNGSSLKIDGHIKDENNMSYKMRYMGDSGKGFWSITSTEASKSYETIKTPSVN